MISYVTVGADDIAGAKRFYQAVLPALGFGLKEEPEGLSYALQVQQGQSVIFPEFYVKPTFDGQPASAGNGSMVAFEARGQSQVRDLHAAGLAAGGEAGPVHSAGMKLVDKVSWPVADLRCDWTEDCPIEAIATAWDIYKPQLDAYVQRALDPREAPSYGVPGDQ